MRNIVFLFSYLLIISCNSGNSKKQVDSLHQWIVRNQEQLNLASDSIIKAYSERNNTDSNWISSGIAITKDAPGILGMLAKKVADSTECIVIELTFYKNSKQKKNIMIASIDSNCLTRLDQIILKTDSTDKFIFGKNMESLY
jgi:hypothetical protein